MITIQWFREFGMSFPEMEELPHFEKTSFRVKKKIVATLNILENRACLKLNEIDQSVFCSFNPQVIYPVPNKWGKQGWTLIQLETIHEDLFRDAFTRAYCNVAPRKLAEKYEN